MESSGPPIGFAVSSKEVPELAELFTQAGAFASVFLSTEPDIENASYRSMQRWRTVRDRLESEGAPAAVLDAIEELVPDAHHLGSTLAAVANESGVLLAQAEPDPPRRDVGRWAPIPSVGPLIEWRQLNLPHVVVLADRVGADIVAFTPTADPSVNTVGEGDGHDPVLRKTKPGGWSQHRYQERAENTWEANAKAVAERVAGVAEFVNARLIAVAGDERALQYLYEHLPDRVRALVVDIDGARGVDGGVDAVVEEVTKAVASRAASDSVEIIEKFREERGQSDRACEGISDTFAALTAAQVETLLIHDDPDDERVAWFGPDLRAVAPDQATLTGYGIPEPAQARLVDVAIAAALQTGARVRIVPSTTVDGGIGGILRFATTRNAQPGPTSSMRP